MNTKSELRLTDTNAASDSKGRTWGLEGNLFWWLIGGVGAGIIVFFVLLVVLGVIMWILLHRSIYGRHLFAVGRNAEREFAI